MLFFYIKFLRQYKSVVTRWPKIALRGRRTFNPKPVTSQICTYVPGRTVISDSRFINCAGTQGKLVGLSHSTFCSKTEVEVTDQRSGYEKMSCHHQCISI